MFRVMFQISRFQISRFQRVLLWCHVMVRVRFQISRFQGQRGSPASQAGSLLGTCKYIVVCYFYFYFYCKYIAVYWVQKNYILA